MAMMADSPAGFCQHSHLGTLVLTILPRAPRATRTWTAVEGMAGLVLSASAGELVPSACGDGLVPGALETVAVLIDPCSSILVIVTVEGFAVMNTEVALFGTTVSLRGELVLPVMLLDLVVVTNVCCGSMEVVGAKLEDKPLKSVALDEADELVCWEEVAVMNTVTVGLSVLDACDDVGAKKTVTVGLGDRRDVLEGDNSS
jgi:hypothetical protein